MTIKEAAEKLESLSKELHEHNYRYYVLSQPVISDYEFDMKLKIFIIIFCYYCVYTNR